MRKRRTQTARYVVSRFSWGTHFCQFYRTRRELIDITAPYIKLALDNNQFCLWITSESSEIERINSLLQKRLTDLDRCTKNGQLKLVHSEQMEMQNGLLQILIDQADEALKNGFDGLRVVISHPRAYNNNWANLVKQEAEWDNSICKHRMIVLCCYAVGRRDASDIIDTFRRHQFTIAKREGEWNALEYKQTQAGDELVQALIRSAATGVYIIQDGKFQYMNRLLLDASGYEEEELLGTYALNLVHPDDREEVRRKAIENLKGLSMIPYEYKFIKKDGNLAWILERVTATEYRGRRAAVGSFMDITERKGTERALQESQERLRRLAEAAFEGICIIDRDKIIDANQQMLGTASPPQICGVGVAFPLILSRLS